MKLIISFVVLFCGLQTSRGLKCYSCDSTLDQKCSVDDLNDDTKTVDCNGSDKVCFSQEIKERIPAKASDEFVETTRRGCATSVKGQAPYFGEREACHGSSGFGGVKAKTCVCHVEDRCNSAVGSAAVWPAAAILSAALAVLAGRP